MKNNFYEGVSKKRSRRRRFTSLVLVLSLFVTSGVSWSLHGVGITMANESECGQEEHKHTDECYEKQLVCGLEEDENHIHSDECYETKLVCGKTEHVHDEACYIDSEGRELLSGDDLDEVVIEGAVINPNGDIVIGDNKDEENSQAEEAAVEAATEFAESSPEENFFVMDSPQLMLGDGVQIFDAQDDQNAPYINPGTIDTIDNIAEGIKFTLFDYGDSSLESQTNNYGFDGNWTQNSFVLDKPYTHGSVSATGINTGRNIEQDIMFFSYGTPVPNGILPSEGYEFYNYTEGEGESRIQYYKPDKNSYAGDYNANPQYSGNRPVSDIVDKTLTNSEGKFDINGYPTVNADGHHSLDYLFNDEDWIEGGETYKKVYKDVNHLLQKKGNFLTFNSDKNYAYFDKETSDFTVYDKTYPVINKNHHANGAIDFQHPDKDGNPTVYDGEEPEFMIGFFPFDEYDPKRRDPNYDGNGYNHHFGMKMEAKFVNPTEENLVDDEPVSFKYSGDDDMWVFVDGKLVLDIGGIHEPAGGMIDFTNGLVWTQDNGNAGSDMETVKQQLIQSGVITNDADWEALPMPIGTDTNGSGNKWIVKPLTDYLGDAWDAPDGDGNKKPHDIKMFYLERGGCYSNLAMEMNLPTLKPLTVKKEVDYQDHLVKDPDIDNKEYEFQVWEYRNGEWVKPELKDTDHGYFKLKDGQRLTIENIEQHRKFIVTEVNVDPNVYDEVSVNGGPVTQLNPGGGLTEISSSDEAVALSDTNSYIFNNRVIQEKTSVNVKKDWKPVIKKLADFTMKYKIMRTDSVDGVVKEVKQIALKYEEEDPETHVKKMKKRRTFALPPEKQLTGDTIDGLLSRYGNHVYTYKVEELNIPMGFKASYSESTETVAGKEVKVLQVTNTDTTQTDIYVKKEWENQPDVLPDVKLVLRREMVGYSQSEKTNLKVKLIDEGGSTIRETTFDDVYANGSAEIMCNLPEGVTLYRADEDFIPAIQKNPDQIGAKYEDDENILVVSNLAPKGNDPNAIANEVTLKIATYKAEDELLLIHHSFTRNDDGWGVQNDMSKQSVAARVSPSNTYSYAKNDSLVVADRSKCFNGATLTLDPAKFKANKTYTFSTYVYHEGSGDVRFNFTFNDGLNKADNQSYHTISSKSVPSKKWTQLTGTVPLPGDIDPYNMFIIVETADVNGDESPIIEKFYMDEFTAVEGTTPVIVEETSGKVTVGDGGQTTYTDGTYIYNYSNMQNYNSKGWNGFGSVSLSQKSGGNDNYAVVVSGRSEDWQGVSKNIGTSLQSGKTYHLHSQVAGNHQNNDKTTPHTIKVSLKYNIDGNNAEYETITSIDTQGNTWGTIDKYFSLDDSSIFRVPVDTSKPMEIYYHTSDTEAFEVWNSSLCETTVSSSSGATEPKYGYSIVNGKYVSDNSNYTVELDENSVTSPLKLDNNGKYSVDTGFSREVLIPLQGNQYENGMGYHWTKQDLNEQNGVMYRYWIEEVKIGEEDTSTEVKVSGDDKIVESKHDDYLISYDRQFVSTNTENSPILVKNKYIWYKLPATGGIGVDFIYAIGLFLMITGLIGGTALIRRERRSD